MSAKVKLASIMDLFDAPSGWVSYVSRLTGEVFSASEEDFEAAEQDPEDDGELPDWQRESVQQLRSILASDFWIDVPDLKFELDEYHVLKRFALSQSDQRTRERLLDALDGRGAFGRAKKVMIAKSIDHAWHIYRQHEAESLATAWLRSQGFEIDQQSE